jgi:hypothetical protein
MKKLIILAVFCFLIISCKNKKTETGRITFTSGDTIFIIQPIQLYSNSLNLKSDTSFNLKGGNYELGLITKVDTLKKIIFNDTAKNVNNKKITVTRKIGPSVTFNFNLFKNKKLLFHKTYSKDIFKNVLGKNHELFAIAYSEPIFAGITENEKTIYTIDFAYPNSDSGIEYYFILDEKGDINKIGILNTFNRGCDGQLSIFPNYILANYEIINNNGKIINLSPKSNSSFLAGVKSINDSVILVIYHLTDSEAENAILMKNDGHILSHFNYKGFLLEMSYHIPMAYITEIDKFILLDEKNQLIRVINKNTPGTAEVVRFDEMTNSNDNEENEGISFELSSTSNDYEFTYFQDSQTFKMEKK